LYHCLRYPAKYHMHPDVKQTACDYEFFIFIKTISRNKALDATVSIRKLINL
jgi:hypothetical protein